MTSRGYVSKDRQFGEVVPAVESDVSSMVCGVEAECVGHRHRRGALQPAWGPADPPLPGVQLSPWNVHGQVVGVHEPGLR